MNKILVIQTAFIGDVILATGLLEKLHQHYPDSQLDIVVRKGNEGLFDGHPFLHEVIVWNKKHKKTRGLRAIRKQVRKTGYDCIINLHRFASSGYIVYRSGAERRIGFDKNPFSFAYTRKVTHEIGNGTHEIERNHSLIADITDKEPGKPKLYPTPEDEAKVAEHLTDNFVCIAPTSVWYTKQFPAEQWLKLVNELGEATRVYLLGAPDDREACKNLKHRATNKNLVSMAGKLTLLQSAVLMSKARMNYVNDSAPMHLASAMNAPTTAVYCSTVPDFGFGPLADGAKVVQTTKELDCRPCGLHGHKACPKGHFDCAMTIELDQLL